MKVKVGLLREGFILDDDVYSLSNKPILRKNTKLNAKHIEVIKAFLIKEVNIKKESESLEQEIKDEILEGLEREEYTSFTEHYDQTVQNVKKMFLSWQAGSAVNISKVRETILPLVETALQNSKQVMHLYKRCINNEYIYHHSIGVALLSALIAKKMNYAQGEINQVAIAGLLIDSGMSKIIHSILYKNSVLTEQEYSEVKQHPVHSYKMLKDLPSLSEGAKISVLQHHERLDGSGYPLGFKGDKLHPYGKIISLADTYYAMVSARPYRPSLSPFYALGYLEKDQFGKFDVTVMKVLKQLFMSYVKDRKVGLSDGRVAEVVYMDEKNTTKPMVKILNTKEVLLLGKDDQIQINEVF